MKDNQAQIKFLVPISIKNSIKCAANEKSLTMTDYFLSLHKSNIESPIYSNDEQKAIIREIGLHLINAKQSLLLNCTKTTLSEIEEALKKHETFI